MDDTCRIAAQAEMHHAFLLGLQPMILTNKGPEVVGDWMFRLFRRQHLDKFLTSFDKLGLTRLSDAVACAEYHVISSSIGVSRSNTCTNPIRKPGSGPDIRGGCIMVPPFVVYPCPSARGSLKAGTPIRVYH